MDNLQHILPLMVPIIAIVMGIGIAIVSLVLDYRRKRAMYELVHKERLAAIEKGMELPPLPPEFMEGGRRRNRTPADSLRTGLVLLFVGIAISVALYVTRPTNFAWAWGLVPAAVGLARLLAWKLSPGEPGGRDGQAPGG